MSVKRAKAEAEATRRAIFRARREADDFRNLQELIGAQSEEDSDEEDPYRDPTEQEIVKAQRVRQVARVRLHAPVIESSSEDEEEEEPGSSDFEESDLPSWMTNQASSSSSRATRSAGRGRGAVGGGSSSQASGSGSRARGRKRG